MASLSLEKLIIPFSSLGNEDEMYEYFLRPDLYEDDQTIRFPREISVEARIQKIDESYLLFLTVNGECELICDRCDEPFTYTIDNTINTLFSFSKLENEDESDSEVRVIKNSDHGINIGPDVRDAIALAIPSKHICKKSCKGLCAQCGKNLNVEACQCNNEVTDPRWDALKNIKFDE